MSGHALTPVGARRLWPEEVRLVTVLTHAGHLVRFCTCGHLVTAPDEARLHRVMAMHVRATRGGRTRHPSAGPPA